MQTDSGLQFEISVAEYLGGVFDLTGEVVRIAVRSAGAQVPLMNYLMIIQMHYSMIT